MNPRKWIESEVQKWQAEGLVSPDQARRILARYQEDFPAGPPLLITLFSVFGAVCIGLGLILVFGSNWQHYSREAKLILSFFPLVCAVLFAAWVFYRPSSASLRESSSAFLSLALAGTMALVSQVYQIQGEWQDLARVWVLAVFPLLYFMHPRMTLILWIGALTAWACAGEGDRGVFFWAGLTGILPWFVLNFKTREGDFGRFWVLWAAVIAGMIGALSLMHPETRSLPSFWSVWMITFFAGLYTAGRNLPESFSGFFSNPLRAAGLGGLTLFLYIGSFEFRGFLEGYGNLASLGPAMLFDAALWLAFFFFATLYGLRYARAKMIFEALLCLAPAAVTAIVYGIESEGLVRLGFNAYLFAVSAAALAAGVQRFDLKLINLGAFWMVLLIWTRFFDDWAGFMGRGIAFILAGTGFIGANYMMIRLRKTKKAL